MAKDKKNKNNPEKNSSTPQRKTPGVTEQLNTGILKNESHPFRLFPIPHPFVAYIFLALISFGIYYNSIWNENALDDGIIIQKNEFVLQGTKGIKDILSHDSYYSFYRQMNAEDQLAGGRYRPLSVVSFALEQEYIGTYPSGVFARTRDINKNGIIEPDAGEVNYWKDLNKNGELEEIECAECWDKFGGVPNFKRDTVMVRDAKTGKMRAMYQIDTIKTGQVKDANTKGAPIFEEDINKDGNVNDRDCEVEGSSLRHLNNVLFFSVLVLLIFGLLSQHLFIQNQDLAFLGALLFAIHPIHTEVVANIKSRDEIFSMIFICLTFIFSFRFAEGKKTSFWVLLPALLLFFLLSITTLGSGAAFALAFLSALVAIGVAINFSFVKKNEVNNSILMAGLMFFYALLSKEYAISLLLVVPMTLWLFLRQTRTEVFFKVGGVMIYAMLIYAGMRVSSVTLKPAVPDTELLNNPYLLASDIERAATKTFVLLKYLSLQFFPHPLSSDYSFNTIEYRNLKNPEVWLSAILNLALLAWGTRLFLKGKKISFAFIFYFSNLFWICNLFFDIGATMGERLVFHSSLGVTIAIAWLLTEGIPMQLKNLLASRFLVISLTLVLITLGSWRTWNRNYDWKNDITLFCNDVNTVPNSVLVLGNAGARWIDQADWPSNRGKRADYLTKAKGYLRHALDLHPGYVNGYLNLGLAYYNLHEYDTTQRFLDSATITWKKAESLYPNNPFLKSYYGVLVPRLNEEARLKGQNQKDFSAATRLLRLAYWTEPSNPETSYNLGGAFFSLNQMDSAIVYFSRCIQINDNTRKQNPKFQYTANYEQAKTGLNAAIQAKQAIQIQPATIPQERE
jgi:protein O-mannosyl-transferase